MSDDEQEAAEPISSGRLSLRERQILELLAENRSDREIAFQLALAYTTVKWYNRQIFNKLSVDNRQQAVERAFDLGLLQPPQTVRAPDPNFPQLLTPFVGRIRELEDLTRLLTTPNRRLVTILAPGGMGKTRLALATVQAVLGQFANGVHFVPFAALNSSDQLVPTIASAIGFQFSADRRTSKQQLMDYLRAKQNLFVLDNFEHLIDGAALVADLLSAAPGLKVLATSRERLKLDGETVYPLDGLPYPEQDSEVEVLDYNAVQLFMDCAQRANSRFTLHGTADVVRICQLVQGMPLAIELAGAWCAMLSPAEIVVEITRSADFLRTTMRNVPERLQSVRAVFEATWRRLSDDQRQVFRRLSVFRGGFTRESARVVVGADLETLAGLVDKALLWHQPESGRYSIHELLRQYAAEQLAASGEAETVRNAHRDYFGKLTSEWTLALTPPQQLRAQEVFEADYDNFREAFWQAIETGLPEVIELFMALRFFYRNRAQHIEAESVFGAAIEKLGDQESIVLGKLLAIRADILHTRFRFDQARVYAEKSIDMLRRLGAVRDTVEPLVTLGNVIGYAFNDDADLEAQSAAFHEALEIARQNDDLLSVMAVTYFLGWSAFNQGHVEEAKDLVSQAHVQALRFGNVQALSYTFQCLGFIAIRMEDYNEARQLLQNGLANARKAQNISTHMGALDGLRRVALEEGNLPEARRFAEEAVKIERDLGRENDLFFCLVGQAEVALATDSLEEFGGLLREMIEIYEHFNDRFFIHFLSDIMARYLAKMGAAADALLMTSFTIHHPGYRLFWKRDQELLQDVAVQLKTELPPEVYTPVWEQGQTFTADDILARLRILI